MSVILEQFEEHVRDVPTPCDVCGGAADTLIAVNGALKCGACVNVKEAK